MALELLMAEYGDIADYGEEEEEEEEEAPSLLTETEQQGNNMLQLVVFEESSVALEEEVPEEMTNEIEEREIMSAELAMQRELEYRKKIMELPGSDFEQLWMPVQGEPSDLELWDIEFDITRSLSDRLQDETSGLIIYEKEDSREETDVAEMAANESVKGNIMPVELAIQRELAYQKKIEGMRLQPRFDFVELPAADQERHPIRQPTKMNTIPRSGEFSCFRDQATAEVMRKTMSVELALQRESEYQAKIKRLKLQAGNDFGEAPHLNIQRKTSDWNLGKMNMESSFENSSSFQGRISNPILFRGEVQRERSQQEMTRREMPNERDRTTTMPVELAIQRELEFQKKLQNLQSGVKVQERPILSQGSIPNQRSAEVKEMTPFTNLQFQNKPHNLQSGFKFQAWPIPSQGSIPNQKIAEVKEMAPFTNLAYPLPHKVKQKHYHKNPLFCGACEVLCTGTKDLKNHLRGKRHATVVMLKRNNSVTGERDLVCDICLVPNTDEDSLRRHLSGKKHAANVESARLSNAGLR